MPPIGETLREARMRQELDIGEVEEATKIRGKYLRSLEAEEFDRLPGTTFVRTFLRTYAEYLGLDSQLLVEEYRQRHEGPVMEDPQPFTPPPPSRPRSQPARERRRRPQLPAAPVGRGPMIIGGLVVVLLVLLVIGLIGGEQAPEPSGAPGPGADAGGERGGGRGGGGGEREPKRPPPDDVKLRVAPQTETYVCVDDGDGERVFEGIIAQPESFRAESLLVNLGNTQVDLEVNGERVPLEQGSNPVGFEFTPDGQEELPEGERPCA